MSIETIYAQDRNVRSEHTSQLNEYSLVRTHRARTLIPFFIDVPTAVGARPKANEGLRLGSLAFAMTSHWFVRVRS